MGRWIWCTLIQAVVLIQFFQVLVLLLKSYYSKALRHVLNLSIWPVIIFLDSLKYCWTYILFLRGERCLKFVLIRQSCCKNVQLPQCSSWQSERTESFVLTLSLFHTGENIAFPWLQCWGFHGKKSLAGYVCISRPEIASQFPRLFSQPAYILLYVFTYPLYLPGES